MYSLLRWPIAAFLYLCTPTYSLLDLLLLCFLSYERLPSWRCYAVGTTFGSRRLEGPGVRGCCGFHLCSYGHCRAVIKLTLVFGSSPEATKGKSFVDQTIFLKILFKSFVCYGGWHCSKRSLITIHSIHSKELYWHEKTYVYIAKASVTI